MPRTNKLVLELFDKDGEELAEVITKIYYHPIMTTYDIYTGEDFLSTPLLDGQYNNEKQLVNDLANKFRIGRVDFVYAAKVTCEQPMECTSFDITI